LAENVCSIVTESWEIPANREYPKQGAT